MSDETTIEELENHGFEPSPEIIWEDATPLRPGVDYHDGVTYFTIPAKVNVEKTEGRGKATQRTIHAIDMLVCVTSERQQFPYNIERVADHGYAYPETVTLDKDARRWSRQSIAQFLDGKTEEPDPTSIHAGLRSVYETYVEFARQEYYDIMPLFIMGSYMFRLFTSLGYIHFNGTASSGKSQNLRLLDALAFNTIWSSSITASAMYRRIAGMPGVMLVDEAENWENERGQDLRQILNGGYLDGAKVHRTEKGTNDNFVTRSYETFGPKAIASINPLDLVIGSRCLVVAMRPALRKIAEFDREDERWQRLRDRLYLWAMYHTQNIANLIHEWNAEIRHERAPNLIGRQWQITQLYVILADYLDTQDGGDRCNRLIAFFNEYFADMQRAHDATDRIRIVLKCLPRVLANKIPEDGGFYTLKAIHDEVVERLDADAVEYYKTRNVGKHLDVLGFKNKRSRKGGTQVFLDPSKIRDEFNQRRVEPYDEDIDWLAGDIDYTPTAYLGTTPHAGPSVEPPSIWADIAEELPE